MISAKMATPDFLKITVFQDKGYNVIIRVDDVTKKFYYVMEIILQIFLCE